MNEINLLREHIKNFLRLEKKKQKQELKENFLNEYKLRKMIRQIIKESDDVISHESTGINVLADLLETVVPILKSYYKKLGTDVQQRKSFRAHIIKSVQNLLSPVALMFKAGGFAGKPEQQSAEEPTSAPVELKEEGDEEGVNVKISDAEKDPQFIPLKADRKEKEEVSKEKEVKSEKPEEKFVPIEGEDETGRNIALQSFKRVEKQIREAYSLLANEEDRNLFYDYLITNLKLYFDKFEDELQISVPEPTTAEYEDEKSRKEGELNASSGEAAAGVPAEEPTAGGEEGSLEEPAPEL